MARLIDADALIAYFKEQCEIASKDSEIESLYTLAALKCCIDYFEHLPTVDAVEVVHGRWLPDMEEFDDDPAVGIRGGIFQTGWKCSICGRSERAKEPYCNCGALMDLEVE